MRYKVVHSTEYFYGDTVPLCHNVVHLRPRETNRQKLASHAIAITPNPPSRRERTDFFGNPVMWFTLQEPHESLKIVARSEVEVKTYEPPMGLWWPAWEQVVQTLRERRAPEVLDARQFTFESTYITPGAELADYARPSFAPGRSLLDGVTEFTQAHLQGLHL